MGHKNGLALGQVKVDEKSNEIMAVTELLEALDNKGAITTLDAMGCQKDITAKIIDKQADYVLALKGNHAAVLEEIKEYFDDAVSPCEIECSKDVPAQSMDFFQSMEKITVELKHNDTGTPRTYNGLRTRRCGKGCAVLAGGIHPRHKGGKFH